MRNLSKLVVIGVFALFTLGLFVYQASTNNTKVLAQADTEPTPPPANTNAEIPNTQTNANIVTTTSTSNSNVKAIPPDDKPTPETTSDKKIPVNFTLGQDSFSEYGEVAFNHDTHAFKNYSPDGKSVIGCVECHHTDQPKSALKPPLLTSERDVILTLAVWQKSDQKVSECRSCHFQDGEVPDDKEMPVATYDGVEKELNNELAYHLNCNTCHDAAAKLRPEVKKTKGFATTNDCMVCHKEN